MKKVTYKSTVRKLPGGLHVQGSSRSFHIEMDEPKGSGGTNKAMNPVEAMLGALGGCQTICAYMFADRYDVELKDFSVDIEGDLNPDGFAEKDPEARKGFYEIRCVMNFTTDSPKENVETLAHFIEEICPVGDNLNHGVPVKLTGIHID